MKHTVTLSRSYEFKNGEIELVKHYGRLDDKGKLMYVITNNHETTLHPISKFWIVAIWQIFLLRLK